MTGNENKNKENNSTSWQSGIRYTEGKGSNKFFKIGVIVLIVILSSSIGGAIGSSVVFSKYSDIINSYKEEVNKTNDINVSSIKGNITKIAQAVGPSVVGISKTPTTWLAEALEGRLGSGVVFDSRGYIVTNQHILDGLKDVTVTLSGGRSAKATIVGEDIKSDIAILKINVNNLVATKFGDSDNIKTGETIIGMGNPLGEEFAGSLTVGVISAINKSTKVDDRAHQIYQTDMSFTKGSTGGAVINDSGELIGIINNKLNASEGGSFIMPINEAKPIVDAIMKSGKIETPFLGIRTIVIDNDKAKQYNVPAGLGIIEVVKGTTAEAYGILKGDILLSIDDGSVVKITDIKDLLEGKKPGDNVKVKVYRKGKEITINTILKKK